MQLTNTIFFILLSVLFSCSNESLTDEPQSKPLANKIEEKTTKKELEHNDSKELISKAELTIPEGYLLHNKIEGDLNEDGIDDVVLMIKGTDSANVVMNRFDDEVDRNRRGLLIYLSQQNNYFLAIENLNCFYSENEDGGVYFPPVLSISIKNNKLYFDYTHGRYGYWQYTFRYQALDFALIGYDASENYGPIVQKVTSINFLTKRKLTRDNLNKDNEASGDENFKDTWENIDIQKLYKLSEIKDFEELDVH